MERRVHRILTLLECHESFFWHPLTRINGQNATRRAGEPCKGQVESLLGFGLSSEYIPVRYHVISAPSLRDSRDSRDSRDTVFCFKFFKLCWRKEFQTIPLLPIRIHLASLGRPLESASPNAMSLSFIWCFFKVDFLTKANFERYVVWKS